MKFKATFIAPTLDLSAYRQYLNKYMEDWLKQAGREWLYAFIETTIPHWSGASRATFEKLALELGTMIPYGTQKSIKNRIPLGREAGNDSGLELDPNSGRWHFKYHNTLRYLTYNEYNKVVYGEAPNVFSRSGLLNPTPYHFQEKGLKAFEDFARFTVLPNPFKFLRKIKV